MMRSLTLSTLIVLLLLAPVQAQESKSGLDAAVEAQDWSQAITILDQMISEQPGARDKLLDYRQRLVNLAGPEAQIPAAPPPAASPTPTADLAEFITPQNPVIYRDDQGQMQATIDTFDGTFIRGTVTNLGQGYRFNIRVIYELLDPTDQVIAEESILTVPRDAEAGQVVYYDATTPAEGAGYWVRIKAVRWEQP